MTFDMIQTTALAAVVLFAGYGIRRRVPVLDRFNIPAPVVGGVLFSALALALRQAGLVQLEFDTTLQAPFMNAFFTCIGLGVSLSLLRVGGPQVLLFWGLASLVAALQGAIGIGLARVLDVNPFLGLITGSITMTGGHGTGAAFGKLIEEQYHFPGALTLAMAAATFGLVSGGLIGGPVASRLIQGRGLTSSGGGPIPLATAVAHSALDEEIDTEAQGAPPTAYLMLQTITLVLVCMWLGGIVSGWINNYFTIAGYIGAMLVAAVIRNVADFTGVLRIAPRVVDDIGTIALSLFLSMALMSLRLWELFDLALPMLAILTVQVALMGAFAYWITFRVMGRDYDAAVMAGGHCGFGLGATPNAIANMGALEERFGPAPRAFLVVPMVGGMFIDFTNALIISTYINLIRP